MRRTEYNGYMVGDIIQVIKSGEKFIITQIDDEYNGGCFIGIYEEGKCNLSSFYCKNPYGQPLRDCVVIGHYDLSELFEVVRFTKTVRVKRDTSFEEALLKAFEKAEREEKLEEERRKK